MSKNKLLSKLIVIFALILIITSISLLNLSKIEVIQTSTDSNKMMAVNSSTWDTSKVTAYTDSNGAVVPIPRGYVVSGVSGENVVKTGLVIYEGTASVTSAPTSGSAMLSSAQATRNQWVWVPVSDPSRIYKEVNGVKQSRLYSFTTSGRTENTNNGAEPGILLTHDTEHYMLSVGRQRLTRETLMKQMQMEFDETIKSIQKYGGFYIGRYETGNVTSKVPVVKKMNTILTKESWFEMIEKATFLGATSAVKTNILYSSLYDETITWLVESGNKTYSQICNSSSWGNHSGTSFTYVNTSGSSVTKSSSSSILIPTGSTERNKANNIYDLAGNAWDWTYEGDGEYSRKVRGGSYDFDTNSSPSSRGQWYPTHEASNFGTRTYLYIK